MHPKGAQNEGLMDDELEVKALVLVKGEDTYYFLYTPEDTDELVESLIDIALDPSLSLSWNEVVYSLREHGLAPSSLLPDPEGE